MDKKYSTPDIIDWSHLNTDGWRCKEHSLVHWGVCHHRNGTGRKKFVNNSCTIEEVLTYKSLGWCWRHTSTYYNVNAHVKYICTQLPWRHANNGRVHQLEALFLKLRCRSILHPHRVQSCVTTIHFIKCRNYCLNSAPMGH